MTNESAKNRRGRYEARGNVAWSADFEDVINTNLKPGAAGSIWNGEARKHRRKTDNSSELSVFGRSVLSSDVANDSNFDRNPLRGCNYGLEGGAFLILGGCTSLPKEEKRLHEIMC